MNAADAVAIPLSLRPYAEQNGRVAAWLIPGGDAHLWLRELCEWRVPLDDLRLLILPNSLRDPRPAGLLVLLGEKTEVTPSPLAQPYRCIAGRLYVPAETQPWPPLGDAEMTSVLVWEVQVLHPGAGSVGCRREQLLHVSDLLTAPPPAAVDWERARPGVAVEPRVKSVRPAVPPVMENFMRQSGDDIAGHSPTELAPLPDESTLRQLAAKGMLSALAAGGWLAHYLAPTAGDKPPKDPGAPAAGADAGGWVARLQHWIARRRLELTAALEEARQRELARLMRLLESDPDQGLRYALPLVGTGSGRGVATPGGRMGPREVNFSGGSLGSSRPSDNWAVDEAQRRNLRNKYIELANRELGLGRHRRAAYVYAELLGDFASAANVLRQGRFFREAALLYRDRLHNIALAAECLEEGGLLAEAIDAYLAIPRYEKAADLQRRMGNEADAVINYRKAAEALVKRGDVLAAARLTESKLADVDGALMLLDRAWSAAGRTAAPCLEEWFGVVGRASRNDEALRRVGALRREKHSLAIARPLADVLAVVATAYPGAPVRRLAADATRVVAGWRLGETEVEPAEARALTAAVARAAVDDLLLARDARRFVETRPVPRKSLPERSSGRREGRPGEAKPNGPTRVSTFMLGYNARWHTAVADGSVFFAQGVIEGEELIVVRSTWDGRIERAVPHRPSTASAYRLARLSDENVALIPVNGTDARALSSFIVVGGSGAATTTIFTPSYLPAGPIEDCDVDEDGRLWVLHGLQGEDEILLSAFNPAGELRWSETVSIESPNDSLNEPTLTLTARSGMAFVTANRSLHVYAHDRWVPPLELGGVARHVAASAAHTLPRLAITFGEGGCVCWPRDHRVESFGAGLFDAVPCLLPSGHLVAVGRGRGSLYRLQGGALSRAAAFDTRPEPPTAVIAMPTAGRFLVLYEDGLAQVFEVP